MSGGGLIRALGASQLQRLSLKLNLMSDKFDTDHLEKIYIEASQWVRMCNSIIWTMGTILVPLSATCVGLALQRPDRKFFLAPASVFLFALWVYVTSLYRGTAASARQVLMKIEDEWGIKDEMALYKLHGQVGLKQYSLFNSQVICLVILIVLWIILLVKIGSDPRLTTHSTGLANKLDCYLSWQLLAG
jgi:hypothetical protein